MTPVTAVVHQLLCCEGNCSQDLFSLGLHGYAGISGFPLQVIAARREGVTTLVLPRQNEVRLACDANRRAKNLW